MSTADISMGYSSLSGLANEIQTLRAEFGVTCSGLDALMKNLDGQWRGTAQKEFAVSYSKLQPKLKIIDEVLGEYITAINGAVVSESSTESDLAGMFHGFGGPAF